MVERQMNDELEVTRKETVMAELKYYRRIYLEGLTNTTKTSIRIANVPVEIRTELLPEKKSGALSLAQPSGYKPG
jgi:predicted DNA-binding helix-hairpin-helix protein